MSPFLQSQSVSSRLLPNQYWNPTSVDMSRGHHVVLLWSDGFPAPDRVEDWDWIRDSYVEFTSRNAIVIVITCQSVSANQQFADRLGISFDLLSDPGGELRADLKRCVAGAAFPEFCLVNPDGKVVKWSLGGSLREELKGLLGYLDARRVVGDRIPSVDVFHLIDNVPQAFRSEKLFSGSLVVLFGVPGAFTPACTGQHLPGFVSQYDAMRSQGVEDVICIAVNDPFVMNSWGKSCNADGRVRMIADGDGNFTRAMGLELDLRALGLGIRSKRYAMIVKQGVITHLNVEAGPFVGTSDASTMLGLL